MAACRGRKTLHYVLQDVSKQGKLVFRNVMSQNVQKSGNGFAFRWTSVRLTANDIPVSGCPMQNISHSSTWRTGRTFLKPP